MTWQPDPYYSRGAQTRVQGEIPATYVRLLAEYLQGQAQAPDTLKQILQQVLQDKERLSVSQWQQMLEQAAKALQDPLLGLHLGQGITPTHFGVMGYVLLACDNLGAALQRLEKYHRLLYDVNPLQIDIQGSKMRLQWGYERGRPGALVDETAITAMLQFARNITGTQQCPSRIEFINPAPDDITPMQAYFGCPVIFEQPATAAVFPLDFLQQALRQPDPGLLKLLESQAQRLLAQLPEHDALLHSLRQLVAQLAPEGEISLQRAAQELAMSERTLHRRLQEQGTRFRALRDDTLRRMAEDYLGDPHLQLADVALLLGYSEQSAFNRAFKRWTGTTPRAYQLAGQV